MTPCRSPVLSLEQISKHDHIAKQTLKFSAPPDSGYCPGFYRWHFCRFGNWRPLGTLLTGPRNLRAAMTPLIITEAKPAEPLAKGPVLRVENVSKSFGANRALHPVSLQIGRGEVVAIVGRSGS